MKKVLFLLPIVLTLLGCNKSPEWITIHIWDNDEQVDSVYIQENSTNSINMSVRRKVISGGVVVSDRKLYTKAYSILDGFYGNNGFKYFDSNGKCLVSSWTKDLPTDVYTKYNSFDDYNFFTYKNDNEPRYVDYLDFVIPELDVELCKISQDAYLKFDLTFKGKASSSSIGISVYDRKDGAKETFYYGTEEFDTLNYSDHHLVFKVSTRAALYGHVYVDFLTGSLNNVYLKNELHKISYSLSSD